MAQPGVEFSPVGLGGFDQAIDLRAGGGEIGAQHWLDCGSVEDGVYGALTKKPPVGGSSCGFGFGQLPRYSQPLVQVS